VHIILLLCCAVNLFKQLIFLSVSDLVGSIKGSVLCGLKAIKLSGSRRWLLLEMEQQEEDLTITDDAVEKDKDNHSEFLDNVTELKRLKA